MSQVISGQNSFFTIIIAVYNCARYLQRCLDSITCQTASDFEIIVIDGGSTDGTVDIIKNNSRAIAYWESNKDRGIYDAWNKALKRSQGKWSLFLGADDVLASPQTLAEIRRFVEQSKVLPPIIYGRVRAVTADGAEIAMFGKPWHSIKRQAMEVMSLPHQGVIHHRSLFDRHGDFDCSFRVAGDFDLLLRELKISAPVFMPDIVVTNWQLGGISSSGAAADLVYEEFLRARQKNNLKNVPLILYWNRLKMHTRKKLRHYTGATFEAFLADIYRRLTGRKSLWFRSNFL